MGFFLSEKTRFRLLSMSFIILLVISFFVGVKGFFSDAIVMTRITNRVLKYVFNKTEYDVRVAKVQCSFVGIKLDCLLEDVEVYELKKPKDGILRNAKDDVEGAKSLALASPKDGHLVVLPKVSLLVNFNKLFHYRQRAVSLVFYDNNGDLITRLRDVYNSVAFEGAHSGGIFSDSVNVRKLLELFVNRYSRYFQNIGITVNTGFDNTKYTFHIYPAKINSKKAHIAIDIQYESQLNKGDVLLDLFLDVTDRKASLVKGSIKKPPFSGLNILLDKLSLNKYIKYPDNKIAINFDIIINYDARGFISSPINIKMASEGAMKLPVIPVNLSDACIRSGFTALKMSSRYTSPKNECHPMIIDSASLNILYNVRTGLMNINNIDIAGQGISVKGYVRYHDDTDYDGRIILQWDIPYDRMFLYWQPWEAVNVRTWLERSMIMGNLREVDFAFRSSNGDFDMLRGGADRIGNIDSNRYVNTGKNNHLDISSNKGKVIIKKKSAIGINNSKEEYFVKFSGTDLLLDFNYHNSVLAFPVFSISIGPDDAILSSKKVDLSKKLNMQDFYLKYNFMDQQKHPDSSFGLELNFKANPNTLLDIAMGYGEVGGEVIMQDDGNSEAVKVEKETMEQAYRYFAQNDVGIHMNMYLPSSCDWVDFDVNIEKLAINRDGFSALKQLFATLGINNMHLGNLNLILKDKKLAINTILFANDMPVSLFSYKEGVKDGYAGIRLNRNGALFNLLNDGNVRELNFISFDKIVIPSEISKLVGDILPNSILQCIKNISNISILFSEMGDRYLFEAKLSIADMPNSEDRQNYITLEGEFLKNGKGFRVWKYVIDIKDVIRSIGMMNYSKLKHFYMHSINQFLKHSFTTTYTQNSDGKFIDIYSDELDFSDYDLIKIFTELFDRSKNNQIKDSIILNVDIKRILLRNKHYIRNFVMNIAYLDGIKKIFLSSFLGKDGYQSLFYEDGGTLAVVLGNLGYFLKAVGISNTVDGGNIDLRLNKSEDGLLSGMFSLRNFSLNNMPFLSTVLKIGAVSSNILNIVELLQKPHIFFNNMNCDLQQRSKDVGVVMIKSCYARGNTITVNGKGVIDLGKSTGKFIGTITPTHAISTVWKMFKEAISGGKNAKSKATVANLFIEKNEGEAIVVNIKPLLTVMQIE